MSKALCIDEGCGKEAITRGYCRPHYERALRKGLLKKITRSTVCSLAGCSEDRYSRGLCTVHYHRQYRTGTAVKRCSGDGCTREAHAKGLCNKCYYRVFVAKKKAADVPMPQLVAASVQRAAIKETRRKRLEKRGITPCAY